MDVQMLLDYIGSLDSETDEQIIERFNQAKVDSADSWILDGDIKDLEKEVAKWAAEHQEPVYPTWWKYLCIIGIIPDTLGDKTLGEVTVERLMHINIPADIAEKLGIEPKEDTA